MHLWSIDLPVRRVDNRQKNWPLEQGGPGGRLLAGANRRQLRPKNEAWIAKVRPRRLGERGDLVVALTNERDQGLDQLDRVRGTVGGVGIAPRVVQEDHRISVQGGQAREHLARIRARVIARVVRPEL